MRIFGSKTIPAAGKVPVFSLMKARWTVQAFGLASLAVIIAGFSTEIYYLWLIPFVVLALTMIILMPETVVFFFITSFFWGRFLFEKYLISITATDAAFVALGCAYAAPMLFRGRRMRIKADEGMLRILAAFFIWAVFTVAINIYHYDIVQAAVSFWWVIKCGELVICYWVAADVLHKVRTRHVVNWILFLSAVQAPVVMWQAKNVSSNTSFILKRGFITGTLTFHHSMLGLMMLVSIAFGLYRILDTRNFYHRLGYGLLCLLYLFIIAVSGTRSVLIGIPVAAIVWAALEFRSHPKTVVTLSLAGAAACACIFFSPFGESIMYSLVYGEKGDFDISAVSRLFIWEGAVRHFFSAGPWVQLTGVGIGAYPSIIYDFVIWSGERTISGAHNNFLHALMETGIIGLVIYSALFLRILSRLYRRSRDDTLAFSCFYLTIVLLVSSLTQETFWFQRAFGSFWMYYMVVITLALQNPRDAGVSEMNGQGRSPPSRR